MRNASWRGIGAVGCVLALTACTNTAPPTVERSPPREATVDARAQPAPKRTRPAQLERPAPKRARPAKLDAMGILKKACDAHGEGYKLRQAFRRHEIQSKGVYRGKAYTAHTYVGAPRGHVIEVSMKTAGRAVTTSIGTAGDACWTTTKGVAKPCSHPMTEAMVGMRKAAKFATLWLFFGAGNTVKRVGNSRVNGKPTYAVEVNDSTVPLVTLFFDTATFKLVRFRWKGRLNGRSGVGTIAVTIQAYKTMGGVAIPWKRVMTFNGKKILVDEMTKATLGKVNASKLAKPANLPPTRPLWP